MNETLVVLERWYLYTLKHTKITLFLYILYGDKKVKAIIPVLYLEASSLTRGLVEKTLDMHSGSTRQAR